MEGHITSKIGVFMYLCATLWATSVTSTGLSRRQIIDYLLDDMRYDSTIAPDFDKDYPTNVSVQMMIADVHSVSETSMAFSLDMTLIQLWQDNRLDYHENSTFDKLELDPVKIANVWHPDTFFPNEKSAGIHDVTKPNKLLHIYRNGTVVYSMRIGMTLSCVMDLHLYPFDGQKCKIFLRSFAYTKSNINYNWHGHNPVVMQNIKMNRFNMSNHVDYFDFDRQYWPMGTYSTLRADVRLQRNIGFYFLQVFVPSVLLVILSWVSFWVDPTAVSARVSLSVTCVLTMTTQSSGVRQNLPPVSYVKAIDVWMFTCLLYVFAALLVFAFVNVMLRRHESTQSGKLENRRGVNYRARAKTADKVSRFAFPGSFCLFVFIFSLVCNFMPQSADKK